mgnify:CR=1 FL=1
MDNSLSKVNQISLLADSVSHDKNTAKFKEKNGQDLKNVAEQFESQIESK